MLYITSFCWLSIKLHTSDRPRVCFHNQIFALFSSAAIQREQRTNQEQENINFTKTWVRGIVLRVHTLKVPPASYEICAESTKAKEKHCLWLRKEICFFSYPAKILREAKITTLPKIGNKHIVRMLALLDKGRSSFLARVLDWWS